MASSRAKVAFSVDARLLERVERIRANTGETRSGVIGRALALLTSKETLEAEARGYVAAYRERPEDEADVEAARRRARRTLARLPWKSK